MGRQPPRRCPRCATELKPFQDGRKRGRICPKCGEILADRIPKGYCLGIMVGAVLGALLVMFYLPINLSTLVLYGFVLVCIALILVVLVFVPCYTLYWWIRNRSAPTRRIPATVLRMRQRDWQIDVPRSPEISVHSAIANRVRDALGQDRLATVAEWSDYFVTFGTPEGEIELAVPDEVSESLRQEEQGLLVYRGERFLHFIKHVGTE